MNKYRDKSDFEINKAVANFLKKEGNLIDFTDSQETHVFVTDKYANNYPFDPCNNPADAMPIIIENGISMIKSSGGWICCHGAAGVIEHENLYRAAMEVFLMMKDAENES